nr:glycine betaine ABC transporter substrate-binding protein [Mycolicibacterium stellerae]
MIALLFVAACGGTTTGQSIAVGARDDAESTLLAHLYAAALHTYGTAAHVEVVPDPVTGLDTGDVVVAPGFTGRLLVSFVPGGKARAPVQVYRDMVSALPEGVAAGDYAESAEDKPALAVTEATVDAWGGRDVTAAVRNCDRLKLGGVADAPRPSAIGTCSANVRGYPDAATLFEALRTGQVNAAWTSTADPDIPADAVVLADRTSLIRAENVVPLYRRNGLSEMQLLALNEVAGVLDTAALVQMRRRLAAGDDPADVADEFLAEHPLGATSR